MIQVLWYNNKRNTYEFGTWNEFKLTVAKTLNPHEILPLERFRNTPESTMKKIVAELNKC